MHSTTRKQRMIGLRVDFKITSSPPRHFKGALSREFSHFWVKMSWNLKWKPLKFFKGRTNHNQFLAIFPSNKGETWSNISTTRASVSSGYPNTEKWVQKTRRRRVFLNQLRGVRMRYETLFRVSDMASQAIHNSWKNSQQRFTKFYAYWDPVSKPPSR